MMQAAESIGPMTPELLAALEARGFDAEAFLKLDLGVGESRQQPGSLAIPFYDGQNVVGVKVRAIEQGLAGFGQAKQFGAGGIFYNLNCLSDPELANEPLIVAEGEPGCWAALIAGFPRVGRHPDRVAPTAAASPTSRPASRCGGTCVKSSSAPTTTTPATRCARTWRTAFGRSRCKWVRYPKGCHDLNEALRQFGVRGVQETIRRAQWLAVPDIYAMSELPEPPENPAMDTGIVGLKEHFRVRRGDLTVVTGVPGHGKTSFVNEVVCRLALAHGWRTIFGSFEQRPVPDHRRALRTFHGQKLEKHLTPEERASADAFIDKHFRFLVPARRHRDRAWPGCSKRWPPRCTGSTRTSSWSIPGTSSSTTARAR